MSEEIKYISELSDFIKEISQDNDGKTNLYRGQKNAEWVIEASLFRRKYTKDKEADIYNKIRKYNFEELKKRDCYLDDLIDMQHYGAPTRLIDWSYNPLMSLYFAVAYDSSVDGKLFMYKLDKSDLISFDKEEYKHLSKLLFVDVTKEVLAFDAYEEEIKKILLNVFLTNKRLYFLDTAVYNSRIKAQQGCFLLCLDKKKKFFKYIKDDFIESIFRSLTKDFETKIIYRFLESIKEFLLDETFLIKSNLEYLKDFKSLLEKEIPIFKKRYENEGLKTSEEIVEMNNLMDDFLIDGPESFIIWKEMLYSALNDENYALDEKGLISFIIKADDKEKIRRQLENIGITPMVVYPDLKGTIEHINNKYKEEKKD